MTGKTPTVMIANRIRMILILLSKPAFSAGVADVSSFRKRASTTPATTL